MKTAHTTQTLNLSVVAALCGTMLFVAGCAGLRPQVGGSIDGPMKVTLQGHVMGGQQPVAFSSLQLYAPAIGNAGSASLALLPAGVETDANGNFNFPGEFTCPSSSSYSSQVYLVSSGAIRGRLWGRQTGRY